MTFRTFNPASPLHGLGRTAARSRRGGWWLALGIGGALVLATQEQPRPGGVIAYANNDAVTDDYEIQLISVADGTPLGQLTATEGEDSEPDWSPDATQIVFTTTRDGNSEVYMMFADGSDQVNLTRNEAHDAGADWSPECAGEVTERCTERIAFFSNRDGDFDLYVMDSSGGEVFQITNEPGREMWPSWSPDGSRLAYMGDQQESGFWDVFVIEIATGEILQYTDNGDIDDMWPAWSPDGRSLAWLSPIDGWFRIWLMDADCDPECGARKRLLIDDQSVEQNVHEFDPAWSPDSEWLAFSTYRDPESENEVQQIQFDYEIFIATADGDQMIQITDNEHIDDFTPAWTDQHSGIPLP